MNDDVKQKLYDIAEMAILKLISELPESIRNKANETECLLDDFCKSEDHPEALGACISPPNGPIIIYVEAIYKAENENFDGVCSSIRHVYLHELGHVLGLNEGELDERGL